MVFFLSCLVSSLQTAIEQPSRKHKPFSSQVFILENEYQFTQLHRTKSLQAVAADLKSIHSMGTSISRQPLVPV